jgi:hypothetical protein
MSRFTLAALVATALSMSACGSDTPTTPTTPTLPTSVTDTFSGTLTRNGASTFPFSVSSAGAVYVTLTSVADSSMLVGLSLGTWNGAACTTVISNDAAVQGTSLAGSATGVGTLCTRVYDVGKVADPLDYQLTVVHY